MKFCVRCGTKIWVDSTKCVSCSQRGNRKSAKGAFTYYLKKARDRERGFDLTEEYLGELWRAQAGRCAITGIAIALKGPAPIRGAQRMEVASLDRIDSSRGYICGNVQFVAYTVNLAKSTFGDKAFREHMYRISESMRLLAIAA